MWGPGAISCIIRWLCHIPTGYLAITGLSLQNTVLKVPNMGIYPNGPNLLVGLQLVGIVGVITFAWNFVMFAASPFAQGNVLGVIGVVDMTLGILIAIGVMEQSSFLPGSYGKCHSAGSWKSAPNGHNFFKTASKDGMWSTPFDVCFDLTKTWAFAIAISIIYVSCGILNMKFGFGQTGCRGRAENRGVGYPSYDFDMSPVGIRLSSGASYFSRYLDPFRPLQQNISRYYAKIFRRPNKMEDDELDLENVPIRKRQSWDEEDALGTAAPPRYEVAISSSSHNPPSGSLESDGLLPFEDGPSEILGFADGEVHKDKIVHRD